MRVVHRPKFLEQAEELQLLADRAQRGKVGLGGAHLLQLERNWNRSVDGREALAQQDAIAIVLQALPIHLALPFAGPLPPGFPRSDTKNEALRAPVTDSGSPPTSA